MLNNVNISADSDVVKILTEHNNTKRRKQLLMAHIHITGMESVASRE